MTTRIPKASVKRQKASTRLVNQREVPHTIVQYTCREKYQCTICHSAIDCRTYAYVRMYVHICTHNVPMDGSSCTWFHECEHEQVALYRQFPPLNCTYNDKLVGSGLLCKTTGVLMHLADSMRHFFLHVITWKRGITKLSEWL